jgi:hypothetical protein
MLSLEVVPLPVTDVDRALAFYTEQAGFTLDVDYTPLPNSGLCNSLLPGRLVRSDWSLPTRRAWCGSDVATPNASPSTSNDPLGQNPDLQIEIRSHSNHRRKNRPAGGCRRA